MDILPRPPGRLLLRCVFVPMEDGCVCTLRVGRESEGKWYDSGPICKKDLGPRYLKRPTMMPVRIARFVERILGKILAVFVYDVGLNDDSSDASGI